MSFSPEVFHKKLAVLQDTQESIVSISQWVLFHHRYSKETARVWSEYLLSSLDMSQVKRLSLLHLCNDVVQRARRKSKSEFIDEYAAVLPAVLTAIYSRVDKLTQPKIDRLIAVWEERLVFAHEDILKMKHAIALSTVTPTVSPAAAAAVVAATSKPAVASELVNLNNLFLRVNELDRICLANLTQLGVQSRTYLPQNPADSDSLPVPKIYLSKLNMLEKFSQVSIANIHELQSIKQQIADQLSNLARTIADGISADSTKVDAINQRLEKLESTRRELREMVPLEKRNADPTTTVSSPPPPSFLNEADNDESVPTYESDDDDDDDSKENMYSASPPAKPDGTMQLSMKKRDAEDDCLSNSAKRVAFSEDVQIKEYNSAEGISPASTANSDQQTSPSDDWGSNNSNLNGLAHGIDDHGTHGNTNDIMDLLSKLS